MTKNSRHFLCTLLWKNLDSLENLTCCIRIQLSFCTTRRNESFETGCCTGISVIQCGVALAYLLFNVVLHWHSCYSMWCCTVISLIQCGVAQAYLLFNVVLHWHICYSVWCCTGISYSMWFCTGMSVIQCGVALAYLLFNVVLHWHICYSMWCYTGISVIQCGVCSVIRDSGIQTRRTIFFKSIYLLTYVNDLDSIPRIAVDPREASISLV